MLNIANRPPTLYPPKEAERLADLLNEEDDEGWRYKAKHDPKGTGLSFVVCLDENDEVIGTF